MAWTDERVEQLKKLWAEGLSASQIAKKIGGVTRNAVIGKVHRLGLSGRAAPSRPSSRPARTPKPRVTAAAASAPAKAKAPAARKPVPPPVQAPDPEPLPNGEFATVLTLKDSMCKWPIGDPASGDFRFCGHRTKAGDAYCEAHAQIAYQPQQKRKRKTSDATAALDAIQATRRVNF
ncbi:GcrA family cell cycle regulator [Hyphobacterium sp. HN65]|uniref:GcrA family cell cycle regulator n=1 Tax=Hyphobacterium lacteum TaxID=3116575 RepID=A0ABU7LNJ6_9PROT|nr:GcrA family cell cycle regulator [Hyphobacterium sp. HN65]MEE2525463.1 GcrA family cell cycle regulator [Hyphobacterium sp. HN65]